MKDTRYTLRLTSSTPEQIKIRNFLEDLDSSLFKSRNQFIIDALNYYIDAVEDGSAFEERKNVDEAERLEAILTSKLQQYVDDRLDRFMGGMITAMSNNVGVATTTKQTTDESQEEFEYDEELAEVTSMFVD